MKRIALAGLVAVAVAALAGCSDCPKGQHDVYKYSYPITTYVNNVPIINWVPVYECEANK